jgi:hypothetical protein
MRKQILNFVYVAIVFFLLGTLVSMGLTANGIMPNPFAEKTQTEIIRFTKPDEINITMYHMYGSLRTPASFLWTPKNPQSNIILSIICYFEVRWEAWTGEGQATFNLHTRIYVGRMWEGYQSNEFQLHSSVGDASDWTLFAFHVNEFPSGGEPNIRPSWIRPDQENYNITTVLGSYPEHFPTPTYLRNVNMIMEVIDG